MAPALRMTRIIKEKLPILFLPSRSCIEAYMVWVISMTYNWSYAIG
jgi:hypothetical protein